MSGTEKLTEQQRAVVRHPAGANARVLAVAGSGKTTTLAHRLEYLLRDRHIAPRSILVLMFNHLAREQFKQKVRDLALAPDLVRQIHTFHSYAYTRLKNGGKLPAASELWIGDKVELQRRCLLSAINELVREGLIGDGEIDVEEAMTAIVMWKGALVPPEHAGYRGHPLMPTLYERFERLRVERHGISFDDFIPDVLGMLNGPGDRAGKRPQYSHVIVDEYQDVNLGQQRLIETVAGKNAEVMVVGDDDQTIYEWRGARPDYILRRFEERFMHRPTETYPLTYTFRFGPWIAQCADNVIRQNANRYPKSVVAFKRQQRANVIVVEDHSEQPSSAEVALREEVQRLREDYRSRSINDIENRVVVLGRTFAQMAGLEGEFIRNGVPYRVVGRSPFLERHEVVTLLDYVRVAHQLDETLNESLAKAVLRIANTPNRRLPSKDLQAAVQQGRVKRMTPRRTLMQLADDDGSPLSRPLREKVSELGMRLERLGEIVVRDKPADEVLDWLINAVDYKAHFRDYYGRGEDSLERLETLDALCRFAKKSRMPILRFVDFVDSIDTTAGAPKEEQIILTTVYRTKGLEFDHVIVPSCVEGMMPVHGGSESLAYDTTDAEAEPTSSSVLENERRLFYVAVTRAREQVVIGTSTAPRKGAQDSSSTPLPSRFIEELRVGAAKRIADDITRCTSQGAVHKYVREAIATYEADPSLAGAIENAATRYLPDLGYPKAGERLSRLLREVPAQPYSYIYAYSTVEVKRPSKSEKPKLDESIHDAMIEREAPDAHYD